MFDTMLKRMKLKEVCLGFVSPLQFSDCVDLDIPNLDLSYIQRSERTASPSSPEAIVHESLPSSRRNSAGSSAGGRETSFTLPTEAPAALEIDDPHAGEPEEGEEMDEESEFPSDQTWFEL